ncbi:hypothetical protein OPT61_g4907 [Boeremia exigua]|uniref:Uncharacterized protein n=1 Tax=Boeremia exigua TaxID=749465 RepID=A0ACC2ICH7_9PLEO|nr:hypothetical protein OPT61_g4907 [Boeremia exigua]
MVSPLKDNRKIAIITGAASGIGAWLAAHLHEHGYRVALCGRRQQEGQEIASSLDPSGDSAIFIQCDVKSYSSQSELFQKVWQKWNRIDVLIANAGITDQGSVYNFHRRDVPIEELPLEPDTTCTDTNFKGIVYSTTLATHFMRHNPHAKGGKIIVTGSMIGIYPNPTFPEYCSAKAAAHHWIKTTGPILKLKENVTLNCVMPGAVNTPIAKGFSEAFFPRQMTTKSQLLSAYDLFLEDTENDRSGQTIEAAHNKLIDWGHPEYKSGPFAKRTDTVFEPWFETMHGEKSGLPGTILDWPDQSYKILAVTGATGTQGGGVINVMKKTPGWKIRALTRNMKSPAAMKLAAEGIEVVEANWDDERSLSAAFRGVHAVFAVTQWWEPLFQGKSPDEAGEIEERHGMNIARAAAATCTVEHYIWSTAPSPKHVLKGAFAVPHVDYKANIDIRIRAELPHLAAITTYLYFGYYPQNMAFFPLCKPILYAGTDCYIQTLPTRGDANVLFAGDMSVNPGIWVRQVLAVGDKACRKYANVALEKWTFQQGVDVWSEVTGKRCIFSQISTETAIGLCGEVGKELAMQFKFGELCDPWAEDENFITAEELGIDEKEVVGFRGTIEGLHKQGLFD